MVDGTFVQELRDATARPEVMDVAGESRLVVPDGWTEVRRQPPPQPEPLQLGTLTGLLDFIGENRDQLKIGDLVVHVVSPVEVALRGRVDNHDYHWQRHTYAVAKCLELTSGIFRFGEYLDSELFTIGLQTLFLPTPQRDDIIRLLTGIRDSNVKDTFDDGVAQQVTVAAGVALVGGKKVPNPVTLQPWRTFREIEQPESVFVLRLASGADGQKPRAALIEADGGAWKLEAMSRIATFLSKGEGGDREGDAVAVIA